MSTSSDVVAELRAAGKDPSDEVMARARDAAPEIIPSLIQMATDDDLHNASGDSPDVWAPIHAIRLLGELQAAEAVDALLPLLDRQDDDWLVEELPETFGRIGRPALEPLTALLNDRSRDEWVRASAARSLARAAQYHPDLRPEVVDTLTAVLRTGASSAGDEMLNAFIISDLLTMEALEALPAIMAAFDADTVDPSVVNRQDVQRTFGLPVDSEASTGDAGGREVFLRCTACGSIRGHHVPGVSYDLDKGTLRIPPGITCPKCGAIDQYEPTPQAYAPVISELFDRVMPSRRFGSEADDLGGLEAPHRSQAPSVVKSEVPQRRRKVGRNEPCPCGSGRKYKHCCGRPGSR